MQKHCLRCEVGFIGRRDALYCSTTCRVAASNGRRLADGRVAADSARRRAATKERLGGLLCAVCGAPLAAKTAMRMYCSKKCLSKAGREQARRGQRGYCSEPKCGKGVRAKGLCPTHYNQRFHPDGHKKSAVCECCGRDYVVQRSNQRFCSLACRDSKPGRLMDTSAEAMAKRAAERDRRRRRRAQVADGEAFTELEIYERDRWRCGICRRKVDKRRRWPDPLCASLDHIIPLTPLRDQEAGEHTRANVRLAHLRCNTVRSNRGLPVQLALVG